MAAQLRAGTAKLGITPPAGLDLSGYADRKNPSTGVHDPLFVRALLLSTAESEVALVSLDLIGLAEGSVSRIRERASELAGIPEENILIACTHTHSGPASLPLRELGEVWPPYLEAVERKAAEAVWEAKRRLVPAALSASKAECGINQNRRHPEDPNAPVDREVIALKVVDEAGRTLAVVVNYACHAVVMGPENRLVSADFPGVTCSALEKVYGGGCVALYLQGFCGDLNPRWRFSFDAMERTGRALAGATLLAVERPHGPSPWASLKVARKKVELPLDPLPPKGEIEGALRSEIEWFRSWAKDALKALEERRALPKSVGAELWAVRITEGLAILAVPGEVFSQIGLDIKRESPFGLTMTVGYANGLLGYIPTPEAFEEGGYETAHAYRLWRLQPFGREVGEITRREGLSLLKVLHEE